MDVISLPKRSGLKSILIHSGEIPSYLENDLRSFFYKIISFDELLETV